MDLGPVGLTDGAPGWSVTGERAGASPLPDGGGIESLTTARAKPGNDRSGRAQMGSRNYLRITHCDISKTMTCDPRKRVL
jgi:hypothetical protein